MGYPFFFMFQMFPAVSIVAFEKRRLTKALLRDMFTNGQRKGEVEVHEKG